MNFSLFYFYKVEFSKLLWWNLSLFGDRLSKASRFFCLPLKVNSALSIMKYTVQLPLYLTQLSLLLRAVNKVCLQLSCVKYNGRWTVYFIILRAEFTFRAQSLTVFLRLRDQGRIWRTFYGSCNFFAVIAPYTSVLSNSSRSCDVKCLYIYLLTLCFSAQRYELNQDKMPKSSLLFEQARWLLKTTN